MFNGNGGRANFVHGSGIVAVADISAWIQGNTPSGSAQFFNAALETPEIQLPADCTDDINLFYAEQFDYYSSDYIRIYVDWYDEAGQLTTTDQLLSTMADRSSNQAKLTLKEPKSQRFRVRFTYTQGYTYNGGYWWVLRKGGWEKRAREAKTHYLTFPFTSFPSLSLPFFPTPGRWTTLSLPCPRQTSRVARRAWPSGWVRTASGPTPSTGATIACRAPPTTS